MREVLVEKIPPPNASDNLTGWYVWYDRYGKKKRAIHYSHNRASYRLLFFRQLSLQASREK